MDLLFLILFFFATRRVMACAPPLIRSAFGHISPAISLFDAHMKYIALSL
jgi:hypothetical protein